MQSVNEEGHRNQKSSSIKTLALTMMKDLPVAWISGFSAVVGSSIMWWYFRSIGDLPADLGKFVTLSFYSTLCAAAILVLLFLSTIASGGFSVLWARVSSPSLPRIEVLHHLLIHFGVFCFMVIGIDFGNTDDLYPIRLIEGINLLSFLQTVALFAPVVALGNLLWKCRTWDDKKSMLGFFIGAWVFAAFPLTMSLGLVREIMLEHPLWIFVAFGAALLIAAANCLIAIENSPGVLIRAGIAICVVFWIVAPSWYGGQARFPTIVAAAVGARSASTVRLAITTEGCLQIVKLRAAAKEPDPKIDCERGAFVETIIASAIDPTKIRLEFVHGRRDTGSFRDLYYMSLPTSEVLGTLPKPQTEWGLLWLGESIGSLAPNRPVFGELPEALPVMKRL